eukprot:g1809.t1
MTPLFISAKTGKCDIVEILLSESSIDVNKSLGPEFKGTSPLQIACANAPAWGPKCVELLLQHPSIDVNYVNLEEESALFIATKGDSWGNTSLETIKLLLNHEGCDVTIANNEGKTPEMIATTRGNQSVVEILQAAAKKKTKKKTNK